jgi:hypothetical protein
MDGDSMAIENGVLNGKEIIKISTLYRVHNRNKIQVTDKDGQSYLLDVEELFKVIDKLKFRVEETKDGKELEII